MVSACHISVYLWLPCSTFLWFPLWQENIYLRFPLFMVSVVGFRLFMVSVFNVLLWFPSLVFYGFRACSSKRNNCSIRHQFATALGTHGRAVIVTSPCEAQRPRILTWLVGCVGSIPGVRVFKVIAFACFCLLVACFCLFLFVFGYLFVSFPSREAKPRSRAEKQCYVSCFRYVSVTFPLRSVTFPLRFRCVSVARLPVASA